MRESLEAVEFGLKEKATRRRLGQGARGQGVLWGWQEGAEEPGIPEPGGVWGFFCVEKSY